MTFAPSRPSGLSPNNSSMTISDMPASPFAVMTAAPLSKDFFR
jgi:hypothetical protein